MMELGHDRAIFVPDVGPHGGMREILTIEEVLCRIDDTDNDGAVSVDEVLHTFGSRTFGPLLLIPGLLVTSPLSGIPGFPTMMATVIILLSGQMLIGRHSIWLPQLIRRRHISKQRLTKAIQFLRPVARMTDRFVKPRLTFLTGRPFDLVIASSCVAMGLMMPPLEILPFVSSILGAAVSLFALALMSNDGLLALAAFGIMAAGITFGAQALL